MTTPHSENDNLTKKQQHLDWSDKQRRILTANGKAEEYYCHERGYSFRKDELPHFCLQNLHCTAIFDSAKKQQRLSIVGAWQRTLFYGGTEFSTSADEVTFNLQTNTLFIDLRIPVTKFDVLVKNDCTSSLEDLNGEQLRFYARQHVFGGLTRLNEITNADEIILPCRVNCTRHHLIDWNYVGTGRARPNRWFVEQVRSNFWKEWAYAKDDNDQQYYCEYWEQLPDDNDGPVVALQTTDRVSGIIVIVGDHFNYVINRKMMEQNEKGSLVDLVDRLVAADNLVAARQWLSIQGGHGRISNDWKLDHCIELWRTGTPLWDDKEVVVHDDSSTVEWNNLEWNVFESNRTIDELRQLLTTNPQK